MIPHSRQYWSRALWGYLFIAPVVILFVLFRVYPAFEGLRLSLYHIVGVRERFVGLRNFRNILTQEVTSEIFFRALRNTVGYVLVVVPSIMMVSVTVAGMIYNKGRRVTAFYNFVFHVPSIASAVVMSIVWNVMFDTEGVLNTILGKFGVPAQTYFGDERLAFGLIAFTIVFWSLGRPVLLYSVALGGIPPHYYELADLEGAGWCSRLWNVTVPLTKSALLLILVITTLQAFQTFAPVRMLTIDGGPNFSTTSLVYQLYHEGFQNVQIGRASAIGVILFVIVAVVAFLQFRLVRSDVEY